MRQFGGLILAVIGGGLVSLGFSLFQATGQAISRGNTLWGLGWMVSSIKPQEAYMAQSFGLAVLIIGAVFVIWGLSEMIRR